MLYEKHNYTRKDIKFVSTKITEYDMINAGINILHFHKVLTDQDVNNLNQLEKLQKNIVVGKYLRKNSNLNTLIMDTFIEIRKYIFECNNLNESNVLSIKKDALFIIGDTLKVTEINDHFKFIVKNEYEAYLNLNNKEFYYKGYNKGFDLKGFNKNVVLKQKDYFFNFVEKCITAKLMNNEDLLFRLLIEFKIDFLSNNLPKEFYYNLNHGGYLYKVLNTFTSLEDIQDNMITKVDKRDNLNYFVNLTNTLL